MKKEFNGGILSNYFFEAFLVLFSLGIAIAASSLAQYLPAQAVPGISNLNLVNGYNPEENYLRILLLIIFGLLSYLGLKNLSANEGIFRLGIIGLLVFSLFAAIFVPKVESFKSNIDTFHHGEQLSPALDYEKGKGLYTDLFVLHGAGDDVVVPNLAQHLPGTNPRGGIGSYFLMTTTLQIVSAFLFFLLLSKLFKSTLVFMAASLWFSLSYYSVFYYVRDIFVWLTILIIVSLLIKKHQTKTRRNLLVLVGFIPSLTYFYSVDRGFIATVAVILAIGVMVLFRTVNSGWRFDKHVNLKRSLPAAYALGGAALAQIFGLFLLGLDQYVEFLKTTFITIPKYQGYLFDMPIAKFGFDTYLIWLPIFTATIGFIMLFTIVRHQYAKNKTLTPPVLLATLMYLVSLLFLRIGYGRPDFDHIAYSTPFLFLSIFYLSAVYYQEYRQTNVQLLWPVVMLVVLIFYPVRTISPDRITAFANTDVKSVKNFLMLPRTEDRNWLPGEVLQVSDHIRQNTKPSDPIFVFTQQPIYYYTADRQNSSRFYIPWFADPPVLTNVLLKDLINRPPKIIVYSASSAWDKSDGFTMAERTPEVDAWIKHNYTKEIRVGSALLLEKP